jgi:hypothetical protein
VKAGGGIPAYTYIVLAGVFLFGIWRILDAIWRFKQAQHPPEPAVWTPTFQIIAWACLMLGAVAALAMGRGMIGLIMLVLAVMLPVVKRKRAPKGVEDWPGAETSTGAEVQRAHVIEG